MNIRKKTILMVALLGASFLVACKSSEEENGSKTMEQIQKENGKPAKVTSVKTSFVNDYREYSGSISGKQQSSAIAKLSDPIQSIKVSIGSYVKKDQVLAEYLFTGDNTGKEQAEEQVNLLEASVKRLQEVYDKGGISKQDLEQAETQLRIAKMSLEQAKRASVVLAPANGIVTSINIEQGQVPQLGSTLFNIANLSEVILTISVPTHDIGVFKNNLLATVELNGEVFEGKVSKVPMAANEVTRFFPVEITFKNPGRKLLPGMFVTAKVLVNSVDALSVPNEAIVYQNSNHYVWVVADNKAKRKLVSVGVSDPTNTQITSGLTESETIMIEGMSKMNDGDKVLIVE